MDRAIDIVLGAYRTVMERGLPLDTSCQFWIGAKTGEATVSILY